MYEERERYPAFQILVVVVPTSIDNNLPGNFEPSVGADSALNVNVSAIDKIKMSGGSATTRAFVSENDDDRFCGFQALMSGLAGGAERVYFIEEGIELNSLAADVNWLQSCGRTPVLLGGAQRTGVRFVHHRVHQSTPGRCEPGRLRRPHPHHRACAQGAEPTPADRLLATRVVSRSLYQIADALASEQGGGWYRRLQASQIVFAHHWRT